MRLSTKIIFGAVVAIVLSAWVLTQNVGGVQIVLFDFCWKKQFQRMQERWQDKFPDRLRLRREFAAGAVPYLELPPEFRMPNYSGGSCVHASMETLFFWQGQHELARWWRKNYHGGEYSARLNRRLEASGIKYAYTRSNSNHVAGLDWAFLEKACALRLGAAVNWPGNHMVTCVGIDEAHVYLLDNNATHRIKTLTRSEFARNWTGWAVTPIYCPGPPAPYSLCKP